MEFLRDTCLIRSTATNVSRTTSITHMSDEDANILEPPSDIDADTDDILTNSTLITEKQISKRARKNSNKDSEEAAKAINRIADVLCNNESPVVLPSICSGSR
ncbi:PREDICTED: uncharacterized protein LOC105570792 [Vollenhovia emeryi]|uniref:uncharacterized protein LOC105570792 n=1 Tax=Vollenhovia emeryi TaxID=411798 RepID=UPI0005F4AF8E|nr:PREDICTED: uncharacterized protein LOC105570792 [Vollenhovia emeryi]